MLQERNDRQLSSARLHQTQALGQARVHMSIYVVRGLYRYASNSCQQEEDNDLVPVYLEG